jgi:hypothetical protein
MAPPEPAPETYLYRDRTLAILRRYFCLSIELGRLPSLLGRELFRAHVSSYRLTTFEDAVIFVRDVERAVEQLDRLDQQVIAHVVFQDYSQHEAARLLQVAARTVSRRYPEALDQLSAMFLSTGLIRENAFSTRRYRRAAASRTKNRAAVLPRCEAARACQAGELAAIAATDCKHSEYFFAPSV